MHTKPPQAPQLNFTHIKRSLILKQQILQKQQQQQHSLGIQRHSLHLNIPKSPQPILSTHSPSICYKNSFLQEKPIQHNSLNQARFSILELNNHKNKILRNSSGSIDINPDSNNKNNLFRLRQAPRSLGVCPQIQNTCKSPSLLPKKESLKVMNNPNSTTHYQNNDTKGQIIKSQYQVHEPFKRDSSIGLILPTEKFFKSNKRSCDMPKSGQFQQQQPQKSSLEAKLIHLREKTAKIQFSDQQKDPKNLNEDTNNLKQKNSPFTSWQKQWKFSLQSCMEPQQIPRNEKYDSVDNLSASREAKGSVERQESHNTSRASLLFGYKDSTAIRQGKTLLSKLALQRNQQQEQKRIENRRKQQLKESSIDLSQNSLFSNITKDLFSSSLGRKLFCEESEEGTEKMKQIFSKQVSSEEGNDDHQNNLNQVRRITKNTLVSSMKPPRHLNIFLPPTITEANSVSPKHDSPLIIPVSTCGNSIALEIAMMSICTPLKGKAKASSTDFSQFQLTKEGIYCKFHSDNKKKAHSEFIQSFFPSQAAQENKLLKLKFV